MKILHVTPHLGGGVGTVIIDWMMKIRSKNHTVMCLDTMNDKGKIALDSLEMPYGWKQIHTLDTVSQFISESDIVLVHYWDHPMLAELFFHPLPDCRMAFWCHKNIHYLGEERSYPDRWINTSPVQGFGPYIWSTGNMDRFLTIEPKPHEGFNIGTVVSKKMDILKTFKMFMEISAQIPDARFFWIGDDAPVNIMNYPDNVFPYLPYSNFNFIGKVDDVAPYLAEMDVFAYPLRPDHYGTCEIALGEAMCAGVVPMVMDNPAERLIWPGNRTEKSFICEVETLHNRPDLRKELALGARKQAKKLYSIDNMIASWDQVFESMIQNPKTKRSRYEYLA